MVTKCDILICRMYNRELERASTAATWLGVGVAAFQGLSNLAINGVVLVVVGHGGLLLASNQVSPGNLMAFLVATQTIQRSARGHASVSDVGMCLCYRSLASLSLLFGQVVRGLSAGGRVFEYIDMQPRVPLRGGHTLPTGTIKGVVRFEKVSFAYPTRADQVSANIGLQGDVSI